VEAPDGPDPGPDICDAAKIGQVAEPFALFRITGNKDDLINRPLDRIDQALEKGPALVPEEIFLLPVRPPCLSADKDDRRSQGNSSGPASDSRKWIRSTMKEL